MKLNLITESKSLVFKQLQRSLATQDSLVFCVLARLVETSDGLFIENQKFLISVSRIVESFSIAKCPELVGKPKIFFFLDIGNQSDRNPAYIQHEVFVSYFVWLV
jgi:hypothetical protein